MTGTEVMVLTIGFGALGFLLRARILVWLFQFDCPHRTMTFPQRDKHSRRSYSVCCDCGREFWYDALWINK